MSNKEVKELREYMRTKMAEICSEEEPEDKPVTEVEKKIQKHVEQIPMRGHLGRYFT